MMFYYNEIDECDEMDVEMTCFLDYNKTDTGIVGTDRS